MPLHAWERLGIDLFELNKEYYLPVIDYYSRFPIIQKLSSLNTSAIIHLKQIFSEYGIPKTIVTDGGPQFNAEFQDFARLWHFQHIKSSPHHLLSNGLAKRFVQTIKTNLIRTMATQEDPYLALLGYRATPLSHNLPSPVDLLNSRKYHALLPTRALAQRERIETEKS